MEGIFLLGIGLGNTAGIEIYSNHGFPPVYILSMIVATMSLIITVNWYYDEDPRYNFKVFKNYMYLQTHLNFFYFSEILTNLESKKYGTNYLQTIFKIL